MLLIKAKIAYSNLKLNATKILKNLPLEFLQNITISYNNYNYIFPLKFID